MVATREEDCGKQGGHRSARQPLSSSDAVVRFVALGFGSALVPCSAATTRPDDVAVVELADPAARHPISLVHRHPAPTAPSALLALPNAAVGADERLPDG